MTARLSRLPGFRRLSEYPRLSIQLMLVGLLITLLFVLAAIFAPLLQSWGWIQDPLEELSNPIHQPPSGEHWFGTSRQGYDVFSRTIFGAQAALQVLLAATVLSLLVGVPLGMVSGYLGGRLDRILLFLMDTIHSNVAKNCPCK